MQQPSKSQVKRARKEFKVFLCLMWRFLGLPDPTPAQYAYADFLQFGPRRKGIMAFRGSGKSWVTAAFVLWRLWVDPDRKIMVVSASADRARMFTIFVRQLIDVWPLLAELKPRNGQRDSSENFDVGPATPHQSPSVKSVGINGQLTGSRAHDVVLDDVEVPKNSETVTQREKIGELVKEAASVLIPDSPDTNIIYLGTPQTEDTLYTKLPERGYEIKIWPARYPTVKVREAYAALGASLFDELLERDLEGLEGEPTDPDRFDDEDLLSREKEYGAAGWQMQFMLNPTLADAERYPLKLHDLIVASLDHEIGPAKVVWSGAKEYCAEELPNAGLAGDRWQYQMQLRMEDGSISLSPYEFTVMSIDPSGRGKDETSYSIVKVLNGQLFIMDQGGYSGDGYSEPVITKLAYKAKDWGVNDYAIESNFGDGMFTKLASPIFKKVTGRGLDPEDVEVRHNTQKERRIIDTLAPLMAQHKIIVDESVVKRDWEQIDPKDPEAHLRKLFHQMTRITYDRGCLKYDDRLDALAMAVTKASEMVGKDVDEEIKRKSAAAFDREIAEMHRWRDESNRDSRPKDPLNEMFGFGGRVAGG